MLEKSVRAEFHKDDVLSSWHEARERSLYLLRRSQDLRQYSYRAVRQRDRAPWLPEGGEGAAANVVETAGDGAPALLVTRQRGDSRPVLDLSGARHDGARLAVGPETKAPGRSDGQGACREQDCAQAGYSFQVQGYIGEEPVSATMDEDGLHCDALLRSHAEVVVAIGEEFSYGEQGQTWVGSLDGPPAIVLVTLMRCMKVTNLQICLEGAG